MRKNRRELGSKKRRRNEGEDLRDEEESCGKSWPWEKNVDNDSTKEKCSYGAGCAVCHGRESRSLCSYAAPLASQIRYYVSVE